MSRLGQQRDRMRQQSANRLQARKGGQDDQRPPEAALARVRVMVVATMVVVMATIVIVAVVVVIMIVMIMIPVLVTVPAAHGPNISKKGRGPLQGAPPPEAARDHSIAISLKQPSSFFE